MMVDEDDEDGLFSAPSPEPISYGFLPSTSPGPLRTPLRTPVKQSHRQPDRPALSIKHLNVQLTSTTASAGTKRKPAPTCTTPLKNRTMTPLVVTSATAQRQGDLNSLGFDRLAPLSAPRFVTRTPQSKAETEMHLKRQARDDDNAEYMRPGSRLFWADDSGGNLVAPIEMTMVKGKVKASSVAKFPEPALLMGKAHDGVAELVSPGGHITKRRARSRPISVDLMESAQGTPTMLFDQLVEAATPCINESHSASSIVFPSLNIMRTRRMPNSPSPSTDSGSPRRRSRLTPGTMPRTRTQSQSSRTLNRLTSMSSATLFFGPSIPSTNPKTTSPLKKGTKLGSGTSRSSSKSRKAGLVPDSDMKRSKASDRHSYAGQDGSAAWTWANRRAPSPESSSPPPPLPLRRRHEPDDSDVDEADLFFNSGPLKTSFGRILKEGGPSPKKKQKRETVEPLPKKFRPRDSGVVLDESDDEFNIHADDGTDYVMAAMPRASTSVSTVNSELDDQALVTPGFAPSMASGWPIVNVLDVDDETTPASHLGRSVDAFILRTLAGGASMAMKDSDEPKRVPGTPSAVATKIGHHQLDEACGKGAKGKSRPRPSLPAAFPSLMKQKENRNQVKTSRGEIDVDVDADDLESPSTRKESRYDGLGLGRPTSGAVDSKGAKPHWLMRRSSSGAFSSGSETSTSSAATPTRLTAKDWQFPLPHLSVPSSPLKNRLDLSSTRPASGSSSTTSTSLNSPTAAVTARHLRLDGVSLHARRLSQNLPNLRTPASGLFVGSHPPRPHTHAHPARTYPHTAIRAGRLPAPSDEEEPGRFERDFVEIDELGSGEFGRAMKVRYKDAQRGQDVTAIKKSKRFEGVKHRLRLREEVEILKLLSAAGGHANILAYVDSWEEDETLYIQTELCELGNLAHFLWEYGRAFARLDEARVWKIVAELSAGLRPVQDRGLWDGVGVATAGAGDRQGGELRARRRQAVPRAGGVAGALREGGGCVQPRDDDTGDGVEHRRAGPGEAWHRLRQEDFSQVELEASTELWELLRSMMRTSPALRIDIALVDTHPVVVRARRGMEQMRARGGAVFGASPLGAVPAGFLDEILGAGGRTGERMTWTWAHERADPMKTNVNAAKEEPCIPPTPRAVCALLPIPIT
ncbi:Mitosis inhibitor protein kinase wee1 [Grifola frondosa]|uniref:Mitosis inhibitor protein kinase wee1 n=1 Tax=Grifola frondosa TaxID=5627 RepID=A0A1C7LTP4_GRIFR|nr:Mitosis inhibitor protein kinase wee1 [Grifola frondosa]